MRQSTLFKFLLTIVLSLGMSIYAEESSTVVTTVNAKKEIPAEDPSIFESDWDELNDEALDDFEDEEVIIQRSLEYLDNDEPLLEEEVMEEESLFTQEDREPAVEANFVGSDYRLQVGDVLQIDIYGEHGTPRTVVVDPHGQITYLLVGSILAAGKTIDELREELNERMRKNFRFALVNVVPVEFSGRYYTVFGQMRKPGRKALIGETRLLNALASGSGFKQGFFRHGTIDLEDLDHAFVARDGEYVPVDFYKLVVEGDTTQNIEIKDGDYIYIPSVVTRSIYVLGEVIHPSNVGYQNSATLAGAIAWARGVTPRAGRWAYIIRGSLTEPTKEAVNIRELFRGMIKDVPLAPGDIVYVPPRYMIDAEEIILAGIRSFVGATMNVAARKAFIEVHPHAESVDRFDLFFP